MVEREKKAASGRRLCVLQMHYTDADPRLLERSAVPVLVESGLFDRVVLAVADVPENDVLEDYARAFGIALFRGAERDVARRLLDCARATGATTIARALVWWFFVDPELVRRQLELLESSDADWVDLPRDFDLRFGVDAFRPRFLERVLAAFDGNAALRATFGLNPWGYAEAHPEAFRITTCTNVPLYDRARFETVRSAMAALWPERWDGAATPLAPYRLASEFLPRGGRALDVAAGLGAGTALLGRKGDALGVDLDGESVRLATARHGEHARFLQGDALALDLSPASFDLITSIHTMEHVSDDRAFLRRVAHWLKPDGRLVLEVPLQARRPFLGIETPLSPAHVREYERADLVARVSEQFAIERTQGVARGAYLALERARSAGLVVAKRRAA